MDARKPNLSSGIFHVRKIENGSQPCVKIIGDFGAPAVNVQAFSQYSTNDIRSLPPPESDEVDGPWPTGCINNSGIISQSASLVQL
jgi:hypothetical protein